MLSPNAKAFMIDNLLSSSSKRRILGEDDVIDDLQCKAFMIDNLLSHSSKRRILGEDDVIDDLQCNINGCNIPHKPHIICKDNYSDNYIRIELYQQELWSAFHQLGTEMIITRNGRRMFPCVRIKISHVDPSSLYKIYIDFETTDRNRYRYIYQRSRWINAGVSERSGTNKSSYQVQQIVRGKHLLSQPISFEKLKLTNKSADNCGKVCLQSMQRYLPRITVLRISETHLEESGLEKYQFSFPQTSFVAVTAYQNQNITQLKISENPFAKGFRKSSVSLKKAVSCNVPIYGNTLIDSEKSACVCLRMPVYDKSIDSKKSRLMCVNNHDVIA